jgi:hypothetical protein
MGMVCESVGSGGRSGGGGMDCRKLLGAFPEELGGGEEEWKERMIVAM